MMTKASSDNLLTPVVWTSEKAKEYWFGVANQDLCTHIRLMESYCIGAFTGERSGWILELQ